MSDYVDFRKKAATDRSFAAKFEDCDSVEALVAAAAREGYSFTVEDIKNDTELLTEEVALAVGGDLGARTGGVPRNPGERLLPLREERGVEPVFERLRRRGREHLQQAV